MDDKYQILAKKFIREYYTYPNDQFDAILDFSKWLDSQEKSGGKKKIEKLDIKQSIGKDPIVYSYENRHKINELVDFLNAEK